MPDAMGSWMILNTMEVDSCGRGKRAGGDEGAAGGSCPPITHSSTLPTEIGRLSSSLKTLKIYDAIQIKELPSELGLLTALTNLELRSLGIKKLPSELGLLNLTNFELRSLGIKKLPSEIGLLTALTKLVLHSLGIKKLPSEIGLLTALTNLELRSLGIKKLPSELGLLAALTTLELNALNITSVPSLARMTNLHRLLLEQNRLSRLPDTNMSKLTSLVAPNNALVELPAALLPGSLTTLGLNNNTITAIPASIGRLTVLESLNLQHNVIESLGPFAKGAECPDNEKKEASKDAKDHGSVKLFGNNGVSKKNATLNGTGSTSYLDGYKSDKVRIRLLLDCPPNFHHMCLARSEHTWFSNAFIYSRHSLSRHHHRSLACVGGGSGSSRADQGGVWKSSTRTHPSIRCS